MKIFESDNEKAVSGEIEKVLDGQGNVLSQLLSNYEKLDLCDKGISYTVVSQIEKIVKEAKGQMNDTIRKEMGAQRVFETPSVKITYDVPEPSEEQSVDLTKLKEVCDQETLVAMGILVPESVTTVFKFDEKALEKALLEGRIERSTVESAIVTTDTTKAPRLIVTAKGDLKKRLAKMKKACLPSGE